MSTEFATLCISSLFVLIAWMPIEAKSLRIPPIYPEEAAAQCVEGYVVLQYRVGDDGFATDIRIVESEPSGFFEEASLENIARWKFEERGEEMRETTLDYTLEHCESPAHNKGFNRTPVSSRAAKPGEFSGGAG